MPGNSKFVDAQPSIHLEPHFAVVRNFDELQNILQCVADTESLLPNMINIPVPESMLGSSINRMQSDYLMLSPSAATPSAKRETRFPTVSSSGEPFPGATPQNAGKDGNSSSESTAGSLLVGSSLSPTRPKPRQNRILCVWDVDDTLVASGTSGVRQHAVFREAQMRTLFRDLDKAGATRHILLSQGSIDDVFAKDGTGRLRYLQKYFFSEEAGKDDDGDNDGGGKSGFGGSFACGRSSKTKKKPSALRNPAIVDRNTHFVRLARIHGDPVKESEVAWLAGDGRDAPTVENGSLATRWLVMRPSLAGISLCSLNTPVQPSPYTAFVDGKALRKLDVVWSLAVSGHWDNVFFIDNNLSEVGVVTNNMQMSHLFDLQSEHKESRFFHNELTMLSVSSLIRNLCYLHGRDVTVPPSKNEPFAETPANGAKAQHPLAPPPPQANGAAANKPHPPSVTTNTEDTTQLSGSVSKESGQDRMLPLTPSSSTANSSSDNVEGGAQARAREQRHVDPLVIDATVFSQPRPQAADSLSPVRTTPDSDATPPPRLVRLVIANLHIPFDTYKRLLTSRTSAADDGTGGAAVVLSQKNMTRRPNNMAHAHYRGQPLFNKDMSCTDDQYESIIRMFRSHLAFILDLMVEDLRQQGYLLINPNSKYPASIAQVMVKVYHVPNRIPCIKAPYQSVCQDIERMVLVPLQKGGGTKEGVSTIKSCAHSLFQRLVQTSPLVDPLVIGNLCSVLVEMYLEDGSVSKAQTKRLEAELRRVLLPRA